MLIYQNQQMSWGQDVFVGLKRISYPSDLSSRGPVPTLVHFCAVLTHLLATSHLPVSKERGRQMLVSCQVPEWAVDHGDDTGRQTKSRPDSWRPCSSCPPGRHHLFLAAE